MVKLLKSKIANLHKIVLIISLITPIILHFWASGVANVDISIIYKIIVVVVSITLPVSLIISFIIDEVRDIISMSMSILPLIAWVISVAHALFTDTPLSFFII